MTIVVVLLSIVVALLAVLVAGLLRSHAAILRRLHELGVGLGDDATSLPLVAHDHDHGDGTTTRPPRVGPDTIAPPETTAARAHDVVGTDLHGGSVAIRTVGVDHDTVLLFLSSGCTTCHAFWRGLRAGEVTLPQRTRLVVVAADPDRESPSELAALAPQGVTLVLSSAAFHDHEVPGSPYVIHIDGATGRILGQGTGPNWPQVARMLAQATGDLAYLGEGPNAPKARADAAREADSDRALLAAGFVPGDPRLYQPLDGSEEPA